MNTKDPPFIPYKFNLRKFSRKNRKNPTPAESKIWDEVLKNRQFHGYKFLRQKPLGNYIADFYCSKLKLAIEIDGPNHDDQSDYDEERTYYLNYNGIQVLRYTNDDVLCNIDKVIQDLNTRFK